MIWIIIILSVALVAIITLYFTLENQIKTISNQLDMVNKTPTNVKILTASSNKAVGRLARNINSTIDEKQRIEIEHKRMDKELRQAIANMSHDLRTPLTSIMGYMQLIEDEKTTAEDRKQYVDIVKKRGFALKGLIESFYEMSRLEAREYKFDLKPVNLHSIMCDMIGSFYKDFTEKKIEPSIDINENLPMVIADENGVRRIISNLIQNMLRYGNNHVYISLKQQEDLVVSIFENDAPLITEADVPHLFERFFTVDRTRSGKSTGLGLAITKELVEQMGHSIEAELHDGKLSFIISWKV